MHMTTRPNVWGPGAMFALSGYDCDTDFAWPFVGRLMEDAAGIDVLCEQDTETEALVSSLQFWITSEHLTLDDYDEMFLLSDTSTNPGEATVCSGDSGGPQFFSVDGEWVQGAVHSWSDIDCAIRSGSTRVDVAAEWLLDNIEDVHGSRDPCEFNGWYDDGECDEFCEVEDPDCEADPPPGDDDDPKADGGCRCAQAEPRPGIAALPAAALLIAALFRRRTS